jgi:hypothetical protein
MNTNLRFSIAKSIQPLVTVSRWALNVFGCGVMGAAVVATVGAFYGLLYGTLDGVTHANLSRILPAAAYFTVCGACAGAILFTFGRVVDPEGIADINRSLFHAVSKLLGGIRVQPRLYGFVRPPSVSPDDGKVVSPHVQNGRVPAA